MLPLLISNAAPTPTTHGTRRLRLCSFIHRSCFGVLRPIQRISGFAA